MNAIFVVKRGVRLILRAHGMEQNGRDATAIGIARRVLLKEHVPRTIVNQWMRGERYGRRAMIICDAIKNHITRIIRICYLRRRINGI